MKYFKLGQDRRIPYGALLPEPNGIAGYYEAKKGNLSALDDVISSFVNSSPVNYYPDILDRQLFMVKGVIKEVFDLFLPNMEYKRCLTMDDPLKRYEQYFIPGLEILDLHTGSAHKKHIFRLADTDGLEVAASLEAVEAMLRRKPTGVRISPIV